MATVKLTLLLTIICRTTHALRMPKARASSLAVEHGLRSSGLTNATFSPWWKAFGSDPATAAEALASKMSFQEKTGLMQGYRKSWNGYALQRGFFVGTVLGVPSLGVPPLLANDAGQGYRTVFNENVGTVTVWPSQLSLAATWDAKLAYRYASAMGAEFRAKGTNMVLGPQVDIIRVGKAGRNGESLCGEDPQLCVPLVSEYVKGMKSQGVAAVLKHFALNTQETNRGLGARAYNSYAMERALWEVYYVPFQAGVDAGVAAVMCAYNGVGGTQACENPKLLKDDLKKQMGFRGFVMTDWWSLKNKIAGSKSGLDMVMAGNRELHYSPTWDDADFERMGDDGVHDSARRILWGMLNSGAYDFPDKTCIPGLDGNCKDLASVDVTSVEHTKLAREVAAASVVMLQNDGVLPISRTSRVLVVGYACSVDQFTDGSWDGDYYVNGGSGRLLSPRTASVLKGIVSVGTKVTEGPKNDDVWAALEFMRRSSDHDVVIACGGASSREGKDRDSLRLDQHDFLVQLAAENAKLAKPMPLVIVTMSGGSILTDFRTNANAILSTFLAGQETGRAVADVLFGDVNPSGRLPVTFPQKEDDVTQVCWDMHCGFTEGLSVGWRNLLNKPVAFPFGHGLSYGGSMAFRYYTMADSPAPIFDVSGEHDYHEFSVLVQNVAAHQGREVAQLYLKYPAEAGEPEKVLRGFHRTSVLLPGRSEKVTFKLYAKDVSIWSEHVHKWQIVPGTYQIEVGSSSRDVIAVGNFKVRGPEPEPTPGPTRPPLYLTDVPVLIQSHRQQNLKDNNGQLQVSPNADDWEHWRIIDEGNGKVTIKSHRDQNLQDNDGRMSFSGNSDLWEQWTISDAGNGKVTIRSHRNQNLQDANGHVGLSENAEAWEQWSIIPAFSWSDSVAQTTVSN